MGQRLGRVLCVDDEPNILRSLQWLLQKDFEVKTAPSGTDGLALVRANDFDVVISDQRMPGMTGSEFLREVRKLSPRSMRILLTGYSDMQAILRSVNESEVFRFINKPWNIQELPKVVAQACAIVSTVKPDAPAPAVTEASKREPGMETILLVDDDPAMAEQVRQAVGGNARVALATNLAEAVMAFNDQNIGVVVSETRVGNMDATRLLKMLKQQQPDIVSVVFSNVNDANSVIGLINEGQIFRFIPKPIKPGFLKVVITSAILKHQQLLENPAMAGRHQVNRLGAGAREALLKDVQQIAQRLAPARAANDSGGGLIDRLTGGFRRLFGAH